MNGRSAWVVTRHRIGYSWGMLRFHRLRRGTAIAAHLFLLQLVFSGGTSMCPLGHDGMHGGDAGMVDASESAHQAKRTTHSAHDHHRPASAPEQSQTDAPVPHHHAGAHCDMACTPANCGSAGHCSTSSSLPHGWPVSALLVDRDVPIVRGDEAPHWLSAAPEPPPPRA
jgi:hypothetical protein